MTSASMVLIPREDPLGKIIFVVLVLALGVLFFISLVLLLSALMPGLTARSKNALTRTPWKAFFLGCAVYLILGGWAGYLLSGSYVRLLLKTEWVLSRLIGGCVIISALLIVTLFGAPGTVGCLGDRLAQFSGLQWTAWKKTIGGTLVLVLASWFPLTGWFIILPAALMLSLGALLLSVFHRSGSAS